MISNDDNSVPKGLKIAGAWSWRLIALFGAIAVFIFLFIQVKIAAIPFLIAILITALVTPLSNWLQRHRWPKGIAVVTSLVALVVVIGGLLFVAIQQIVRAFPDLKKRGFESFESLKTFLSGEPFNISANDINNIGSSLVQAVQDNSGLITTGISSVGLTAAHVFAGVFLVIFAVIFMLLDGKNVWKWTTRLFPKEAQSTIDGAGKASWVTLTNFVKSQVAVAGVDAVGIGLGAFLLQIPLAIPIAAIVFLGSFVPVVGAVVTGSLAVIIALIFNGWVVALIMLGVVLLVQLLEGHILQPFLIGKAVKIHPLAIVFAVAIGSIIAGIPGALFAVPFVAVLNTMVGYIRGNQKAIALAKQHPKV